MTPSLSEYDKMVACRNIKTLLTVRKIPMSTLARSMGVCTGTVEREILSPSMAAVSRIALAIGVPERWILDENMDLKSVRALRGGI